MTAPRDPASGALGNEPGRPDDEAVAAAAAEADPVFEAFRDVCLRLAGFHPAIDICWVDGYLTALAATCRSVTPQEWLHRLADDAFERAFADPSDSARATAVLQQWIARRRAELEPQRLMDHPDSCFLTPLFDEWSEEDRSEWRAAIGASGTDDATDPDAPQTGYLWANGFLDAIEDFGADWPAPPPDDQGLDAEGYRTMLQLLAGLAGRLDEGAFRAFAARQWRGAEPTRDELLDEACFAVQDLRLHGLDHMPGPELRRVDRTPGRNEPCPCGSGRKYKKCHGA